MRALDIDLEARTAWADAGLTAGEYTAAAATCGLATGFGDTGSVGIGGITLGGGVGLLVAQARPDRRRAAGRRGRDRGRPHRPRRWTESHPDLFWALRGGGGNFGVVTRFLFRLEELDGIIGGMLLLPASPEVIEGFVAEAQAAPDELTTIASVMPAPPLPFVPPEQHGRPVVMATLAYAGEAESGRRAIAPLRALAEPIVDMVRPMAYPDVFPPEQEGPQPLTAMRTLFVDDMDRAAAETILERLAWATAPMAVTQLRVLGGAVARVPADATAFAHRERRMMANVAAVHGQPERADLHEAWASEFAAALRSRRYGRLRQLPGRRRRGARPRGLSGGDVGPARSGQGALRPRPTSSTATRTCRRRSRFDESRRTPRRPRPAGRGRCASRSARCRARVGVDDHGRARHAAHISLWVRKPKSGSPSRAALTE